jgi:hypothetical protein
VIEIRYKSWRLCCDPEATRTAYAQIESGAPERCGCDYCRNFIALREQSYPREVLDLLAQLGIDYRREAEVYHLARLPGGLHQYGGWFHFIGTFEGPEPWEADASGRRRLHMVPIDDRFSLTFRREAQLAPEPLKDQPLVQLEFAVQIPWILDRPEPD